MFLAASFFGALFLVPIGIPARPGESPVDSGWLVAAQGPRCASPFMPIAGALADRFPVGRIVPVGLLLIVGGMFALTQVTAATTSYWGYLIPVLFIMGLGMGATMMPLMTSALRTLRSHQVARGSTLLNSQQVASSIGIAVISVVFTNLLAEKPLADRPSPRGATRPSPGRSVALAGVAEGTEQAAEAFAGTFLVAAVLVSLTLIPAPSATPAGGVPPAR